MQAIETKYLGPSNVKGSRVKATCAAKTRIIDWDDSLNPENNHKLAARILINELGWGMKFVSGCLKSGNYVHVLTEKIGAK